MSTELLERRYGAKQRPRWPFAAGVATLVVLGLGWVFWASQSQSDEPLSYQLHSYEVVSDHETTVKVELHRNSGAAVVCEVYAQAVDHTIVGERVIGIPAGERGTLMVEESIATDRRATTGLIRTCRITD